MSDIHIYLFRICDEALEDWSIAFEISFNSLRLSATGKGYAEMPAAIEAIDTRIVEMLGQDGHETFSFSRSISPYASTDPENQGHRFAKLTQADFRAAVALFAARTRRQNDARD